MVFTSCQLWSLKGVSVFYVGRWFSVVAADGDFQWWSLVVVANWWSLMEVVSGGH